ncbi:MAG TPA: zinc finger, RING-type domain-containing protein [Chlamydiales bacterium]|nr:zinc finger, RING-type domain-containing protein [Chlamydiales bacterium]
MSSAVSSERVLQLSRGEVRDTFANNGVIVSSLSNRVDSLVGSLASPWSYTPLPIGPTEVSDYDCQLNSDNSSSMTFPTDRELQRFQEKWGVWIEMPVSTAHPITLPSEVARQIGIPETARSFAFISPASQTFLFQDPSQDTLARRAEIVADMNTLRPAMRDLLIIGGFVYYTDGPAKRGDAVKKPDLSQRFAGINVLSPQSDLSDPEKKHIYFGQFQAVNGLLPLMYLAEWAQEADAFYNPESPYHPPYPPMSRITVGPLLEKGLTHFKWLEPGHELLNILGVGSEFGAFIYYSRSNPEKSCVLPVEGNPDEWRKRLRRSIPTQIANAAGVPDAAAEIEVPVQQGGGAYFGADECLVCFEGLNDKNVVYFEPCHHANMCVPCFTNGPSNQPYENCPTCNEAISSWGTHKVEHISHVALGEKIALRCAPIQEVPEQLGFLRNDPNLRSPQQPIPEALRNALQLPKEITSCSFLYPVYGKSLDLTHSYLTPIQQYLEAHAQEQGTHALAGLIANGGFMLYDASGKFCGISAILLPDAPQEIACDIVELKPEALATPAEGAPLAGEIEKLCRTVTPFYNTSRITLVALMQFAQFFQYDGAHNCFYYGQKNGANGWKGTLVNRVAPIDSRPSFYGRGRFEDVRGGRGASSSSSYGSAASSAASSSSSSAPRGPVAAPSHSAGDLDGWSVNGRGTSSSAPRGPVAALTPSAPPASSSSAAPANNGGSQGTKKMTEAENAAALQAFRKELRSRPQTSGGNPSAAPSSLGASSAAIPSAKPAASSSSSAVRGPVAAPVFASSQMGAWAWSLGYK